MSLDLPVALRLPSATRFSGLFLILLCAVSNCSRSFVAFPDAVLSLHVTASPVVFLSSFLHCFAGVQLLLHVPPRPSGPFSQLWHNLCLPLTWALCSLPTQIIGILSFVCYHDLFTITRNRKITVSFTTTEYCTHCKLLIFSTTNATIVALHTTQLHYLSVEAECGELQRLVVGERAGDSREEYCSERISRPLIMIYESSI